MKTHYLLIDFENVQPKALTMVNGTPSKVFVFLGEKQSKVPVDFAKELQKLGSDAEYIQISGSGSNALDFHIAFTIGELSKADPDGCFHIISKDAGFDPLIRYAKKKGIRVQRSSGLGDKPKPKPKPKSQTQSQSQAESQSQAQAPAGKIVSGKNCGDHPEPATSCHISSENSQGTFRHDQCPVSKRVNGNRACGTGRVAGSRRAHFNRRQTGHVPPAIDKMIPPLRIQSSFRLLCWR